MKPPTGIRGSGRAYRLITSDDPCKTLAQGEVRSFARIIDAANAFAQATEPFKQIVFDDGSHARELNRDETWMLESVCRFHGYDFGEVGAGRGRSTEPSPTTYDRRVSRHEKNDETFDPR